MTTILRIHLQQFQFSFGDQLYEQMDGLSMGSCLAPVLLNIILIEFEKDVVNNFIQCGTIKFYSRYVVDALLLINPHTIPAVLTKFNSFDKNLKFLVDSFATATEHFVSSQISKSGKDIFQKPTHTGQY